MNQLKTLAVIAAACLGVSPAWSTNGLPAGSLITGQVSGATTTLLGLDHGYADEAGSHITALSAPDIEYITGDYAIAVDFFSDGRLEVTNNRDGDTSLPGSYTLTFSFIGLSQPLVGFVPLNLSGVNGGSVSLQLIDDRSVSLTLTDLSFAGAYGSFTTQLNVSAVPEPASLVLMGAGLGLLALRLSRRAAA